MGEGWWDCTLSLQAQPIWWCCHGQLCVPHLIEHGLLVSQAVVPAFLFPYVFLSLPLACTGEIGLEASGHLGRVAFCQIEKLIWLTVCLDNCEIWYRYWEWKTSDFMWNCTLLSLWPGRHNYGWTFSLRKTNKQKSYNHVSAIEKNFYILIFRAFPEFDKFLKQSGNLFHFVFDVKNPNGLMFFVCVFLLFPVEVLKGENLIQGLSFVPFFSSGNGKRRGMRKGEGLPILLQLR